MGSSVAILIPVLDEEETIAETLRGFAPYAPAQMIVVDNGSTDGSAAAARAAGATVISEPRRGYGQACLAGIAALDPEIDIVVFADADGSDTPADLPQLLEPILRGEAELAIGSRTAGDSEPGSITPLQFFGNRFATALMRILFGIRHSDLGPFRAIRRSSLRALEMRDANYGWTVEMQVKAHKRGLRVVEIPVRSRRRRGGKSKISGTIRGSLLAGVKILWTVVRYRFAD